MDIKLSKTDVIAHYGTVREVAKLLDISTQAVNNWGEFVPKSSALQLYILTDKKLGVIDA